MSYGSAPWIKIITRIFEDPKIIAIEQLPEADGILILWFKLLTLAGEQNRGGSVYFTDRVPFTANLLAAKWRCKPALVQMAFEVFQKFGMIGVDEEGTICILNWAKYQNEEGLARIRDRDIARLENGSSTEQAARGRELAAARQRRHRQKEQRGQSHAVTRDCHAVTHQNKIEIESRSTPPSPQMGDGTDTIGLNQARQWLSDLFGRKRSWSAEEDALLAKLLPISFEDQKLIQWGYSLDRDLEGWALIDGRRVTKRKQSLVLLLREFGSELDKWRSVAKNGEAGDDNGARPRPDDDGWTAERKEAAVGLYGEEVSFATAFWKLGTSVQREIDDAMTENKRKVA